MAVDDEHIRLQVWGIIVNTLNYFTLFLVPLVILSKTLGGFKFKRSTAIIRLSMFLAYSFFILYFLYKESIAEKPTADISDNLGLIGRFKKMLSPNNQFNLISRFGVCIISALSGFSCIYLPFEYFKYFNPLVTQINKERIEDDMRSILNEMREDLLELTQMNTDSVTENPLIKKGFINNLFSGIFGAGNKHSRTISTKKKNIRTSQTLLDTMFIDYCEISKEERNYERSRRHRWRTLFEKGIAILLLSYGIFKIIMTMINIIFGRNQSSDPVSKILKLVAL